MSAVELTQAPGLQFYGVDQNRVSELYNGQDDLVTQEVFIQLMMTQMQHQDPLEPMENQEFLSQLAQLTSVEQLRSANSNLEILQLYQSSINNAQSVSFLGKNIKAAGDSFQFEDDGSVDLSYRLGSDAAQVKITIFDGEGNAVRVIDAGNLDKGEHEVEWDGRNDDGSPLPAGEYTYAVSAKDGDGNTVSTLTFISGLVDGVTFEGGIPLLHVGSQKVTMGEILEINQE